MLSTNNQWHCIARTELNRIEERRQWTIFLCKTRTLPDSTSSIQTDRRYVVHIKALLSSSLFLFVYFLLLAHEKISHSNFAIFRFHSFSFLHFDNDNDDDDLCIIFNETSSINREIFIFNKVQLKSLRSCQNIKQSFVNQCLVISFHNPKQL